MPLCPTCVSDERSSNSKAQQRAGSLRDGCTRGSVAQDTSSDLQCTGNLLADVMRCYIVAWQWVLSEHLEAQASEADRKNAYKVLADCNGILVPGGFGERSVPVGSCCSSTRSALVLGILMMHA